MNTNSLARNVIEILIVLVIEIANALVLPITIIATLAYAVVIIGEGLPSSLGDPTLPDIFLPFVAFGLILDLLKRIFRLVLSSRNKKHFTRSFFYLYFFVFLVSIVDISLRHFGAWAQVKAELNALDKELKTYELQNGPIGTEADIQAFRSIYPEKSVKVNHDQELFIRFWYPGVEPRVGVAWGNGGSARLDLHTMYVYYAD